MREMIDTADGNMDKYIDRPVSFIEIINDICDQGRWIDLPIIAINVDNQENASALIDSAFLSGDEDIVRSCLKNMDGVGGILVSVQSLLTFLSVRQSNRSTPKGEDLVASIAGSAVTMNVIDRYRSMVEHLLAHKS